MKSMFKHFIEISLDFLDPAPQIGLNLLKSFIFFIEPPSQEDQQQQGENLLSLASNLQEHREEHGKQLRSTSNEAQKDLLENLSKTNATWRMFIFCCFDSCVGSGWRS